MIIVQWAQENSNSSSYTSRPSPWLSHWWMQQTRMPKSIDSWLFQLMKNGFKMLVKKVPLDNEESDVLAVSDNQFMQARHSRWLSCKAPAVKIFSAVPVSMVDERAMSVVTWLNSSRRKQQQVPTMANHPIIRGFNQLDQEVCLSPTKQILRSLRQFVSGETAEACYGELERHTSHN
jgi:hypothetical protein